MKDRLDNYSERERRFSSSVLWEVGASFRAAYDNGMRILSKGSDLGDRVLSRGLEGYWGFEYENPSRLMKVWRSTKIPFFTVVSYAALC